MPAVLLIGALVLGGRIYLRHRPQHLMREARHADAQRWEDDGGALPASGELPRL